jgi:hypothetical protein
MNRPVQVEFPFANPNEVRFNRFIETPAGKEVAGRFIRIACALQSQGVRLGAKAIWERIRWNIEIRNRDRAERYKLNNSHHAWMARFAASRVPSLRDYVEFRESPQPHRRRVLVISDSRPPR